MGGRARGAGARRGVHAPSGTRGRGPPGEGTVSDVLLQLFADVTGGLEAFFRRDALLVLRDCLDIGLVAVLAYWVLSILKGTRAMQMAIGLALVFLGYAFSRSLGLITVWTMIDSFLTYMVLIVVIIFQNDIRRGLARMGGSHIFRSQRTAKETAVIEEVIKACSALAQKRIGAIVVFERSASLDEFIELGTELDAAVTKELLYTIFIPSFENPMHDGAVIIREGRCWQAGAFLPLAGSSGRDRTLGARHRAAIGISEESDAVVVVVSEERGAVSLCFNGNIVRNLDANSLRDALCGKRLYKRERPILEVMSPRRCEKPGSAAYHRGRRNSGLRARR
ncbi:MAG: TIGR00159 family protein, partial [Deltaproteobacteria bacterium]|nr:TIGR00159 family protein [Deltaproteobacteria bacterium]